MGGVSLAMARWQADPFYTRVFCGDVLDLGGANDSFAHHRALWPAVTSVTTLDTTPGPQPAIVANLDGWTPSGQYQCILASHVLEHLAEPANALAWEDALAPGGHLIVLVPDWVMYERRQWPPTRNLDHKTVWQLCGRGASTKVPLRNLVTVARMPLVRALTLDVGWEPDNPADLTATGQCECGLEAVWRKPCPGEEN